MPTIPVEGALSALAIFVVFVAYVWKTNSKKDEQMDAKIARMAEKDKQLEQKNTMIEGLVREVMQYAGESTSSLQEVQKSLQQDRAERAGFQERASKEHGAQIRALEILLDRERVRGRDIT